MSCERPAAVGEGRPPVPSIVAHRGASEDVPEHTLAAYRRAIEDGADGLECDVRLTADGHLVCVHDWRVNRTSNGRGAVSALELADLAALDFGSWKDGVRRDLARNRGRALRVGGRTAGTGRGRTGRRATPSGGAAAVVVPGGGGAAVEHPVTADFGEEPDRQHDHADDPEFADRTSVLTLERLLELVVDAGRRVELAVETKHPSRWAGQVETRLVELLDRFGLTAAPRDGSPPAARVMSFSARSLHRVHALAPAVPGVLLMQFLSPRHRDGTLPPGVRIAAPGIRTLRAHPWYVERAHARGHQVHVWTVDRPEDVDLCRELGVDAVITNRPGPVRRQLAPAGG
ncbi:glycerophosphodiester phosphodiesterase family protein [Streptomyces sp. NPDC059740]|uniref:glycerophosphodiester phosphodiesterase family protein n=1 Tax=Streptomyces sp. NPDC059740 TaxID=3346926 RepID=UPI0036689BFE